MPLRGHTSALFRKFGLHGGFDAFAQGFHAGIVGDYGIFSISKSGRIAGANHEINAIHCRQDYPFILSDCRAARIFAGFPATCRLAGTVCLYGGETVRAAAKAHFGRERRTGILWHVSAFTGDTVL